MRTRVTGGAVMVMLGLLLTDAQAAKRQCLPDQKQVNNNNSIVMLGGTAKGPVKQFVLGEFGKDVDQQKRMLGEFDHCGVLSRADISYNRQEGNTKLMMVQNIVRINDGWRAEYQMTVFARRGDELVVVNHKQGIIHYLTGRSGNIIHSSDVFILQGEKGFTDTQNQFDHQFRLVYSVSRGSDSSNNGEFTWRWNQKNQLISSDSGRSSMHWNYDDRGRETKLETHSDNPLSSSTMVDECQLWDERNNCTLSYSHEMEVSARGITRRNLSAAYRFEYWNPS